MNSLLFVISNLLLFFKVLNLKLGLSLKATSFSFHSLIKLHFGSCTCYNIKNSCAKYQAQQHKGSGRYVWLQAKFVQL